MKSLCSFALFFAIASAAHAGGAAVKPAAAAAKPAAGATAAGSDKPYTVVDGTKVDPVTMEGFRAWRAAACSRCHGTNQEGLVGPSLIDGLQRLSEAEFKDIVTNGRTAAGIMPPFKTNQTVMESLDGLYAYLKGRSDGAITDPKVELIKK